MRKPCNYPGCPALIQSGAYCDKHKATAPKRHTLYDQHVRQRDPTLALAAKIRGGERWRRVRFAVLSNHPLCADPHGDHERRGVTRTATQVHHIKGLATHPELAYVASNLMPLCSACHARIEREYRAGGQSDSEPSSRQIEGNGPAFG